MYDSRARYFALNVDQGIIFEFIVASASLEFNIYTWRFPPTFNSTHVTSQTCHLRLAFQIVQCQNHVFVKVKENSAIFFVGFEFRKPLLVFCESLVGWCKYGVGSVRSKTQGKFYVCLSGLLYHSTKGFSILQRANNIHNRVALLIQSSRTLSQRVFSFIRTFNQIGIRREVCRKQSRTLDCDGMQRETCRKQRKEKEGNIKEHVHC